MTRSQALSVIRARRKRRKQAAKWTRSRWRKRAFRVTNKLWRNWALDHVSQQLFARPMLAQVLADLRTMRTTTEPL